MLRLVVEDLGKTLILASIFKKLATLVIMGKFNVKIIKKFTVLFRGWKVDHNEACPDNSTFCLPKPISCSLKGCPAIKQHHISLGKDINVRGELKKDFHGKYS